MTTNMGKTLAVNGTTIVFCPAIGNWSTTKWSTKRMCSMWLCDFILKCMLNHSQ